MAKVIRKRDNIYRYIDDVVAIVIGKIVVEAVVKCVDKANLVI